MPELPLPLDLHLHHRVVSVLDALQGFLDAWEQVDDLLFADQDLTVGRGGDINDCGPGRGGWGGGVKARGLLPEVGVQVFEDLVLVLDRVNDGLHHLGAVAAHIRFGR